MHIYSQTEILSNHGNSIEIVKGNKNEYKQITRQLCIDEMRNTAI